MAESIGLVPRSGRKVPTDKVSEVTFEIYSDSQVEISKAQEMLDLRIKSEFKTRVVEDSFIQDLSSDEVSSSYI